MGDKDINKIEKVISDIDSLSENHPTSYPAGKHIACIYYEGNGIWDVRKIIDDFEAENSKYFIFKEGQRFFYSISYLMELGQICLGVKMSNCNGEVDFMDLIEGNQPTQRDTLV
jgi:hypothetical protein